MGDYGRKWEEWEIMGRLWEVMGENGKNGRYGRKWEIMGRMGGMGEKQNILSWPRCFSQAWGAFLFSIFGLSYFVPFFPSLP